jgi:hypothetical protein
VIVVAKSRLARQGVLPRRSVQELKRDKEWIEKEI